MKYLLAVIVTLIFGMQPLPAQEIERIGIPGLEKILASPDDQLHVVNFWATWCPPCDAEMPDLDALYRTYGESRGLIVLGVNLQEDAGKVAPFVRERYLGFPILLDTDGHVTSEVYHVRPLPTSFIIDRQGYIRDVWNGQIAREAMLARLKIVW